MCVMEKPSILVNVFNHICLLSLKKKKQFAKKSAGDGHASIFRQFYETRSKKVASVVYYNNCLMPVKKHLALGGFKLTLLTLYVG